MRSTIALFILCFAGVASAQTFVGTFVFSKGDVKVLREKESTPAVEQEKSKQLIFEGKKYDFESVRVGHKVLPGEIIQTGTDGKAKIIYPNGDHFNIGPGTSISMPKPDGAEAAGGSSIDLFYGRLRSLISKEGPRSNLKVKTPATTAGVRGTDFFVRHNLTEGSSVTVLRGTVAVKDATKKEPVLVKKAQQAVVEEKAPVKVALAEKNELLNIQKETMIESNAQEIGKLSQALKTEIAALEKTSKEAVLKDIRTDDPAFHKTLKEKADKENFSSSEINTEVVAQLFKQAPGTIKSKPTAAELEGGKEEDVYKKYFQPKK